MQVLRLEVPLLFASPRRGVAGAGEVLHGSSEVSLPTATGSNISASRFKQGNQIGTALQDWAGSVSE